MERSTNDADFDTFRGPSGADDLAHLRVNAPTSAAKRALGGGLLVAVVLLCGAVFVVVPTASTGA
eukprot:CAMPEP_0119286640 /NCGR_PEP_ID=MMETSP1329-20130426/34190_1 /TAXON_ID=114041 /ORGANISM="Genus nov. species nov., Strain RCC1024" /LENGTH=64 /DNA_ID=CAMNT_0007287383 /DNA_START=201 /DNA_END=392 /DNA_ORIENTATION=-